MNITYLDDARPVRYAITGEQGEDKIRFEFEELPEAKKAAEKLYTEGVKRLSLRSQMDGRAWRIDRNGRCVLTGNVKKGDAIGRQNYNG